MIKELKIFFQITIILSFLFFVLYYYFSDKNKKNIYRSIDLIDKKINNYSKKLKVLESDTEDIIEYVEDIENSNKKKYRFWELLNDR